MEDLRLLFPILDEINRGVRPIVQKHYRTDLDVSFKSDDSPVTCADQEIEMFLRNALEHHFPHFSILGEEFGETDKASAYRWIIDPIDGTESFLLRTPLFGTLLALERDGVPILGSIYLPIQDELMIGSPATGTFLNGRTCSVSQTADLKAATLVVSDPLDSTDEVLGAAIVKLYKSVRVVRGFGDCYGYFLVASGAADIMLDWMDIDYVDVAAMLPILQGAGGIYTTVEGRDDFSSESGLAANPLLHPQVLSLLGRDS